MRTQLLATSLLAALAVATAAAGADTVDTLLGEGIHTSVADAFGDGSGAVIETSIRAVRYGEPVTTRRDGLVYLEVTGSVEGTGWGGEVDDMTGPGPTMAAEAAYSYRVPFVLRWRPGFDGTLVYYAHGRMNLGFNSFADSILGADNEGRRLNEVESRYVTAAAMSGGRDAAVFAPNLSGLGRQGELTATALAGPFTGAPLNLSVDVPISRDLARVAQRLLARLSGRAVQRTLGVGHSGGALVLQHIAGGVSTPLEGPHALQRVFTGGNFVTAYRPDTGLIFDGMIPIGGHAALLHPTFPTSAPMLLFAGEADYSAVDSVVYANRLLRAGADLPALVRIYQVGGFPHNFAEIVEATPNLNRLLASFGVELGTDSDRFAPVLAAAIGNLAAWIATGTPPPSSRLNGTALDADADGTIDAIEFVQHDGLTTRLFPHGHDPAIDRVLAEQFELSSAAGFPGTVRRYAEVLAALPHEDSLVLPYVRCRLGGFDLGADAILRPFADLAVRWPNAGAYRSCVEAAVKDVARAGLFDRDLGQRVVFTADNLALLAQ